jgi:hypothetical protein
MTLYTRDEIETLNRSRDDLIRAIGGQNDCISNLRAENERLRAALRIIAGHDKRIAHLSNMDIARDALSGEEET